MAMAIVGSEARYFVKADAAALRRSTGTTLPTEEAAWANRARDSLASAYVVDYSAKLAVTVTPARNVAATTRNETYVTQDTITIISGIVTSITYLDTATPRTARDWRTKLANKVAHRPRSIAAKGTENRSHRTARSPALTSPWWRAWNLVARGTGHLRLSGDNLEHAAVIDIPIGLNAMTMTCTDHDMGNGIMTMDAEDRDYRPDAAATAVTTADYRLAPIGAAGMSQHRRRKVRRPALTSPNGRA